MFPQFGKLFYKQKYISTDAKYATGKIDLLVKICASTDGKYVATTRKSSFTPKNMFPPVRTIFPLLGKIVLTNKKNVFPLKGNMCPSLEKVNFTNKTIYFH